MVKNVIKHVRVKVTVSMVVRDATTRFVNAKKNGKIPNGIYVSTRTVSNWADVCTIVTMTLTVKLIALSNLKVDN